MEMLPTRPDPDQFLRLCAAAFFASLVLGALLSVTGNRLHRAYCRLRRRPVPADVYGDRVRLAGGFAAFLFATIVNQQFVSSAAVIIGGLLIAPERFLLVLTAILRTNGKHVADIAIGVIKMKPGEIRDKWKEDADDSDDDNNKKPPRGQGPAQSGRVNGTVANEPHGSMQPATINKVMNIERDAIALLKSLSSYHIESYSVAKSGGLDYGYDAIALDTSTGSIRAVIEIKYQRQLNEEKTRELIKSLDSRLSDNFSLLIILILESYKSNDSHKISALRNSVQKVRGNCGIAVYRLDHGMLAPVDEDDIKRLL